MKCKTVNNLMNDFIFDRLSASDAISVAGHLRECPDCNQHYEESRALVNALQNLNVPKMSSQFAENVISSAIEANERRSSRVLRQVASGIAASFVFLFVMSFIIIDTDSDNPVTPIVLIEDEIKTVKLAIESAQAVDGIKMTIDLSDNLEISGYENLKQISWRTRLEKGTNVIALPISAIAKGEGSIKARVAIDNQEKIFIINTEHKSTDPNKVESITTINYKA